MRRLVILASQFARMRAHVESCLPLEACGLLAGSASMVKEVVPVTNAARSSVRFRMDPIEQLDAFTRIETQGWDLLGIFHSHPAGPDWPSATDIAEAAYRVVQIIWSRSEGIWQANGYWVDNGLVSEVELDAAGDESELQSSA
jgi:proteasome lid subunit RPN8/RPN11